MLADGQVIVSTPYGLGASGVQVAPPSVVISIGSGPLAEAAKHVVVDGQEMSWNCPFSTMLHVMPLLVVAKIGPPLADVKQVVTLGHAIAFKYQPAAGTVSDVQVPPPSIVEKTSPPLELVA